MINQEKVCDMTRMAAYENGRGEKELNIRTFRRKDFTAVEMIKSFFLGTISYAVLLIFYVVANPEIISGFSTFEAMKTYGIRMGIGYIIFLGAYLTLTFFYARARYAHAKKDTADYMRRLKHVEQTYRH